MATALQRWLLEKNIPGAHIHETLTTLGGVSTVDDLLILEDDDFKELSVEGGFTLLERRKLINAARALRLERQRSPSPAPPGIAARRPVVATPFAATERSVSPQPERQVTPERPSPDPEPPSTFDPDQIMLCVGCTNSYPAREGDFTPERVWYCGKCIKERGILVGSAAESGDVPEGLQLLAALLGAAAGARGGASGAGVLDTDEFHATRDNMIDICRSLSIQVIRTVSPDAFQFENSFGKVFCRVDNNRQNKCVIHTFAYFQCRIKKREDMLKFAMKWNIKHAFTKLQVDNDNDFRMESDVILPEPSTGCLPTRGDMKEMFGFVNDIWQQSIITFHLESTQFAAQIGATG